MILPVETLSPEAFSPFGKVIKQPDLPPDASGPGWTWWGETALMAADERPYAIGYLDLQPSPLEFDWAERHMRSVEVLVPLGDDCIIYVGPPDFPAEPGRLPSLERFRVFRVPQGQGVLMERGVWHGAPLAADRPVNVVVFLLKDSSSLDNSLVRFPETPVRIQKG